MRTFVDKSTNGKYEYSTPSEYIRALIRHDMENQVEKFYIYNELLKSTDDIKNNRIYPSSFLKEINEQLDEELS